METANRDNPPRTGCHVCWAWKRPITSQTPHDPDGWSDCDCQCPYHCFGAYQHSQAATTLTFHAFNNESTPSWHATWSLCWNWPVRLLSLEVSTIPHWQTLALMEAGILIKHVAQRKMVIIQTKLDWRRHGSDERGGSPPQWLAHRQSDGRYPEWRWSTKEEITWEGKKKVFLHPVKDTKILNANLLQNFWMQPCSTLKKIVSGKLLRSAFLPKPANSGSAMPLYPKLLSVCWLTLARSFIL